MARVDGAIFLEVNLDISQAEKALAQLKLKITALESQIRRMSRAPHNDWFKSSLDTLERLKAQAGQMEKTVRRQSRAAAAGGGQDAKKAQDKAAAPQPGPPVQAGKVSAEAPGGGGKGAGKTGSAAQQALAAFQKLPAKIARGADLAGKLNAFALASEHLGGVFQRLGGILKSLPAFSVVQQSFTAVGQQLATALNNMVGSIDWNLLGAGLNLAVLGMADFLYTFDWTGFGMGRVALIGGAVSAVDWNAAGLLLWSGFKLALETLAGLLLALDMTGLAGAASSLVTGFFNAMTQTLQTIEWQAVGEQIRLFLTGLDWQGIANSVFEAIGQAFQAALEFVSGLLGTDLLAEVISEGLTKILELLTAFADWVTGNQEAISNIAAVVGFFAAAFGLVNAAVTLWTAISAAAAAGTAALGAAIAFLTSPIGLAVAAVGAIIAVVALLVKNWDSVKAAAGSAWDAIVQRWSAAGKWFDSAVAQPMRNILNQIIRDELRYIAAAQAAKESVDASEANVSALEASAQDAKTEAAASAASAAASAGSASADAQKTAADRTAAESAKEAAEAAQQEAESAADTAAGKAQEAADAAGTAIQYSGKPPKPQDGTWWVWNADAQEYRDTGIKSVLSIVKSYPSVGDMEADLANMQEGDLVIIASSVGDEDNSKLFVHGGAAWVFLSDLSGLEGVGIASWERTSGDGSPGTADGYTLTLTDGRTFTYSVYNGRDGVGAGDVLGVPFSLELPAGGWSDGDLTVSSPLLLAAGRYSYLVGPAPASRDEYTECVIWAERLTEDGKLLFHSEFDPESTLSVQVLRFETPDAGGAGTARVFNAGSGGGGGGGMKLAGVSIVKPPDKLVYKSGESFDPSGMVVNAAYTNGASLEITGYTYSPQVLTDGVTAVTVSYAEGRTVKTASQPVTVTPVLAGLEVRVPPAKTAYRYLETFDPAGMEADAVYSDGARQAVTGYTYPTAAFAVLGAQEVTLSYTEDGRTVTASVPVTVSAVPLPVPAQAGALTYNGSAQSPVWNGYDGAKMTLGGETSGTDAGTYHAEFALAYGYEWPDGSAEPASVPWTIGRAVIAQLPAVSGTLTFDGTEQSPTFIGYDPDKMTLGGDTAATEPGSYAATFTPTANYQWADGSTGIVAACITFFGAELGLACLTKIFGERNRNG